MTVGEMRYWTDRLVRILNGPKEVRHVRLKQLADDVKSFYGETCPMVRQMLKAIDEWGEEA